MISYSWRMLIRISSCLLNFLRFSNIVSSGVYNNLHQFEYQYLLTDNEKMSLQRYKTVLQPKRLHPLLWRVEDIIPCCMSGLGKKTLSYVWTTSMRPVSIECLIASRLWVK